jgi:F-type H+-transporting ATPase subunit epsilon
MYLEIVSPEATLFAGDVTSVTAPGVNGEFQLLSNHAPIVSLLQEGKVKIDGEITIEDGKITLAIASGTIEMNDNKVIVLVD